jgi:hypothetical protein
MSRGKGRVQQVIAALIEANPEQRWQIDDLCAQVYPGINRIEKKHRVAVARALKGIEPLSASAVPTMTRKQAAQLMNVSERMVAMAKELRRTERADLIEAIEAGRMTMHAALMVAKPEKYGPKKRGNPVIAAYRRASIEDKAEFEEWFADFNGDEDEWRALSSTP